ncbi:MAG TPA: hypothetical protein VHX39_11595 [Acetobacteraceae bacterium]|nr:hypothetical protein [Acetobacteraceae bacterium]
MIMIACYLGIAPANPVCLALTTGDEASLRVTEGTFASISDSEAFIYAFG